MVSRQTFQKIMKRCSLRLWAVPKDPFSPTCTTFLAEVWNPVTHQAIKLESCSNPLRIQQVLKSNSKKQIFRLGLSFSGGSVTSRGDFELFWPSLPGPGRHPNGPFLDAKFS